MNTNKTPKIDTFETLTKLAAPINQLSQNSRPETNPPLNCRDNNTNSHYPKFGTHLHPNGFGHLSDASNFEDALRVDIGVPNTQVSHKD